MHQIVPEATYKRRRERLSPSESVRTERMARVVAMAEYVWEDRDQARRFSTAPHAELGGRSPVDAAKTELGARQTEEVMARILYGLPVQGPATCLARGGSSPYHLRRKRGYDAWCALEFSRVERVTPSVVPGWEDADFIARRRFGDRWYDTRRSGPNSGVSSDPMLEHNVLINQEHPAFGQISATKAVPAHWDARLLRKS